MTTLVHITDLHFGREVPEVIQGLFQALAPIRPELVIISGDVTQRATHEEYQAVQQFLLQLPYPYFIIPGNHDLPSTRWVERFFNPWEKWQTYITPHLEPVLHTDHYIILGINTARAAGWYFDWSRGQISHEQIQFVVNSLKTVPSNQLRIVVAHHPFWLPEIAEYRDVVQNRDKALQSFQQAGVDLILGGHVHMPYTQLLQGVIIAHAGTAFSNRIVNNEPNSFNVIRGNRELVTFDIMQWTAQQFSLAKQQKYQRINHQWQLIQ